jgi:putative sensor histidine kinase
MGEKAEKQYDYLTLCIHYRIISLLLSTAVFLSGMWEKEIRSLTGWGIVFGMFLSCLIGNYLYVRAEKNKDAMGAVLGIELAAYGIFIYLSGGLSSPYLWYVLCCMMISLSGEFDGSTPLLAASWCVACALVGQQDRNPIRLESNILVGVLCTFGNFYVLRRHVQSIREGREELRDLNACLVEENRRSEYALSRVADMYEGFGLMAMTDSERVLGELATLISASVSPEGCVLIRRNEEQMIREIIIRGMPEQQGEELVSRATAMSRKEGALRVNGRFFELFSLESSGGNGLLIMGAPVQENDADRANSLKELIRREREFYVRLCGIIFRGLDMQSQMEAYISAEEKNRIADEIHDTVIQKLFGLNCGLKELELFVQKDEAKRETALTRIVQLEKTAALTMRELRETVYGRNFARSGEQSFEGRLRSYMEEAERQYSVRIPVEVASGTEELKAAQKTVLYRVACEAVNNAARHGGAKHIAVRICAEEEGFVLRVKDDGSGFEEGRVMGSGGKGLRSMKKVAALLGASLQLTSSEGQGTEITLTLPVSAMQRGKGVCIS